RPGGGRLRRRDGAGTLPLAGAALPRLLGGGRGAGAPLRGGVVLSVGLRLCEPRQRATLDEPGTCRGACRAEALRSLTYKTALTARTPSARRPPAGTRRSRTRSRPGTRPRGRRGRANPRA